MKNFLLCLLFTAFSFTSYAQFYDDDDEVVFYENIENGDIIAFNLYGDKGVILTPYVGYSLDTIAKELERDPMFFEKRIFDKSKYKIIHYAKEESPTAYIGTELYYDYDYFLGQYNEIRYTHRYVYLFKYDRSSVRLISRGRTSEKVDNFKRITKEELMNKIAQKNKPWRERTNNNSLYE